MASVRKRPNGSWRARYRDDQGKEHSRHFGRKIDAQGWLDEVTTSVVTGLYVNPNSGKITFTRFYVDWSSRQMWMANTRQAMNLAANSVEFGDVPLKNLRASHFETWIKGMSRLQASTVHTRWRNVHAVIKAAMRDRMIAVDPTLNVTLPRLRRSEAAMNLATVEQVRALLDHSSDAFRPMLALAAFGGLRNAEIRALQMADVNWLQRTIDVQRQAQQVVGGGQEIRAPKYSSERTIYAPQSLLAVLTRHVAANEIKEGWLFPGRGGAPVHASTLHRSWRITSKAAKVTGLDFHDLRHFYASGLISEGCDVVTVQKALGHSSATITLGTYSHMWPSAEDRTRKAAGALFAAVTKLPADYPRTSEGDAGL